MSELPESGEDVRGVVRGFGVVVVLIGAGLAAYGYFAIDSRAPDPKYLIGSLILLFGVIVLVDGMTWVAARRSQMSLQDQYPREPWRWRRDWDAKTSGEEKKNSHVSTIIAIVYVVMLLPFARPNPDMLIVAAAVIAIPVIGWAVARAMRQRRQAGSICRLANVPIEPGSIAAGTIETTIRDTEEPVALTLECLEWVETFAGRGPSGELREHSVTRWRTAVPVDRASLTRGARGLLVPFSIAIPSDALETREPPKSAPVEWRLTIKGGTYDAKFELPVFRAAVRETS